MSRPPEVPSAQGNVAEPVAPGRDLVPVSPPPARPEVVPPGPGVVDLVTRGAKVGVDAAGLLATEVADATVRILRGVLPPAVAQRPLDAVGGQVHRQRSAARRREEASREQAAEALQGVIRQVVDLVLDQIDMEALIDRIPIDHVIDSVDIDAIIEKIDIEGVVADLDIGSIVRDSTTGLAGETVDAVRVQVMGVDLFVARVVDKVLRRKEPRSLQLAGYDVTGPEIRVPRDLR